MGVKKIIKRKAEARGLVKIPSTLAAMQPGTYMKEYNLSALAQAVSEMGFPIYRDNSASSNPKFSDYWTTRDGADAAETLMLACQVGNAGYSELVKTFNRNRPYVAEFRAAAALGASQEALKAILRAAETAR